MTKQESTLIRLDGGAVAQHLDDLCRVLIDSVQDGAAISFMAPLSQADAALFWTRTVRPAIDSGEKLLFAAMVGGRLVGTVQLVVGMPPNQQHRAEISKMIVHPSARRLGLGAALMQKALAAARQAGKTLVTLDTRTGDVSELLYRKVGFHKAGVIPDFAFDPDGKARHATTYMYRHI
ncbi:GNAT family N-acetyltransferase [Falsirhodobacter sp. alg1]|uniref:GNAT family N-acetyltransferase n=1 Tax=Falsirhodobacter sp. alg1 TaxID=1472418 RepID=UPI0005EDCF67|nr:GNAT family N-acetyltransferase [Falsirhodobacter sp. alg1]